MGDQAAWALALQQFVHEVQVLYGDRLRQVILYGSRARGDAAEDADIDTLVVLEPLEDFWQELSRIARVASRISLQYDVVLSALPVEPGALAHPTTPLLINTRREGIRVA